MRKASYLVIGGTGLIGSAFCELFEEKKESYLSVDSGSYKRMKGARAKIVINCDGNTYRYRANQDPDYDFQASVVTVQKSLFDFQFERYVYISTIDLYNDVSNPNLNSETSPIQPETLHAYGFHKWIAERMVEKFAPRSVILRAGTAVGPGLKKGPIYDLVHHKKMHLSLDSELTFVNTRFLASALLVILKTRPIREIYNITGSGGVKLSDLLPHVPAPKLAEHAGNVIYNYNISIDKISTLLKVPSSRQFAIEFIQSQR